VTCIIKLLFKDVSCSVGRTRC